MTDNQHRWPDYTYLVATRTWATFTGPAGTFRHRTELTKPARDLLAKLASTRLAR